MGTRACKHEAAPLSLEEHVSLVFLVRQPVADPHCNVTCPCPPFNPDLKAFGWLFIHLQVELHPLEWDKTLTYIETFKLLSPPLEADLQARVAGIPLCCPSGAFLLTYHPSLGPENFLLALASKR